MGQSIIIPERLFNADAVLSSGAVDGSGNSREYSTGEARPATRATTATGGLDPTPCGKPDAVVDADIILRSDGNVDSARWGVKDHADTYYRGKSPTHVLSGMRLMKTAALAANAGTHPRALALASGNLLLLYLTDAAGTPAAHYRIKLPGSAMDVERDFSLNITYSEIYTIDAVQMPDGEIVCIICGRVGLALQFVRLTAADSPSGGLLGWKEAVVETPAYTFAVPSCGFGMEVLDSGRIACILHVQDTTSATVRSYSDDRGATWATWKTAGEYTNSGMSYSATLNTPGGVSITKCRTGSLVATAPAIAAAFNAATGWTENNTPCLRALVSDDGDSWHDMVTASVSANVPTSTLITTQACTLLEEGMVRAAVVTGDDGLVRFFGAFHGDPSATRGSTIYDDLALLTTRKADITSRDVGKGLTAYQAYVINGSGQMVITVSDAFEGTYYEASGCFVPTKPNLTLSRISPFFGGGSNALDGTGGSSPTFIGVKNLEAVNWRGALWLFLECEDTSDGEYGLLMCRCCEWSEVYERPTDQTVAASILKGQVYTHCVAPYALPSHQGYTLAGPGTITIDPTTYGVKIVASGTATYYATTSVLPNATHGNCPSFLTAELVPVSGGSDSADDIAIRVVQYNQTETDNAGCTIRLTPTGIYVVDTNGASTLGSATSLALTGGVEVKVMWDDWDTLHAVFYRISAHDPEDNNWVQITLSDVALTHAGVKGTEAITVGVLTDSTATMTIRDFLYQRGSSSSESGPHLTFTDYGAASPTFPEHTIDTIGWDDGLRHGTRAPLCCSTEQYARDGLCAKWRGAAGHTSDSWRAQSSNPFDYSRLFAAPVANYWRTTDDNTETFLVLDAGATGEPWKPEAIAFFGCNVPELYVQFNATNAWTSPSVNKRVVCGATGADIARDYYYRAAAGGLSVTVEGAGNTVLRLTGDTTTPLTPHMFRSTNRQSWYVYCAGTTSAFKIIDNDTTRIIVDSDATGAGGAAISIYPDRIALTITSADAGYRYMRIRIPAVTVSDTYWKIGLIVSGRLFDMTSPHPAWGWSMREDGAVGRLDLPSGYVYASKIGEPRKSWRLAWDGMRNRKDRALNTTAPGNQGGYAKLLDTMRRLEYGETVFAFLPEYDDHLAKSGFAYAEFEVYPCRVFGPVEGSQQAFETYCSELIRRAVMDLSALEIVEVL